MTSDTCPRCGGATEPDARFCGTCGIRLDLPAAASLDNAPTINARTPQQPINEVRTVKRPASGPHTPIMERPGAKNSLDNLLGRTLNGRYLVEKKIGEGGYGAVFRGKQIATGREVALKMLHPQNVSDATVVARFRREAEASSKLHNTHTVTIYDFDETEDGVLYLAMELVHGQSLQQLQRRQGPLPPERVLRILDQVAEALAEAHDLGIVHRDMKPENIMVEDRDGQDFVKVLDFGIAKITSGYSANKTPALTAIGQTVGTVEFMSPEQLRGRPLDGRSDIYALGMMAYEALTGELPFKGSKSSTDVIQFHLQKPAPPPSSIGKGEDVPPSVDAIVLKMVRKNRDERHANAAELREAIRRALDGMQSGAGRGQTLRAAAIVTGIALAVAALLVFVLRR